VDGGEDAGASIAHREEATMDQPVDQRLTIAFRLSISVRRPSVTVVRRPSASVVRRPAALAHRIAAALPRPAPATVRRLADGTARRLAIAAVLALAIVLVATVPVYAARLALQSDLWDLGRVLDGPAELPAGPILPLLMGSLVVLAALSSSSGRHHDHW
jgi:hypothetical protein